MHTRAFLATGALLLTAVGCRDDAGLPGEPTGTSAEAGVTAATALTFRQLSAGDSHTCGVTDGDQAYCWGDGFPGKVGNGTYTFEFCMDDESCITQPVAVVGNLRFRAVSAGWNHTCGVTTEGLAYCWGSNARGQLGIGTTSPSTCFGNESEIPCSTRPVAVVGGLRFRNVSAGWQHTCGVAPDNRAYCWGYNAYGQLGDRTTTNSPTPRAVAGGRRFLSVSAGVHHTCGITTENRAYCWGWNAYGQLGDSTEVAMRLGPVLVTGGRRYQQLDAGGYHTCATTIYYRAFCWGRGDGGQLGTGKASSSSWPRRVAGGLSLERVTAGGGHTCGEARDNRAYCWGSGVLRPVAVTGGLSFAQLTAGGVHTCGRTPAAVAYCWGGNTYGQLGDGTRESRPTPTPVADQ
jgi:alpha-tubulin suppressor-like RCC1 family protein